VEPAKIAIQLTFRRANAGVIPDDQGSIHCHDRVATTSLGLNPMQDFIQMIKATDTLKGQSTLSQFDGGQPARFSIPAQVHANEGMHKIRLSRRNKLYFVTDFDGSGRSDKTVEPNPTGELLLHKSKNVQVLFLCVGT
jgi:hypothetical protein